jgi:hypothetical protein
MVFWGIEFAAVTAIAVVLSTATTAAKVWVALLAVIIVATKIAEYFDNVRVRLSEIRYQVQILLTLLPTDGAKVRCTYHCPIHRLFNRTQLAQAFDYVPEGGGGGRRFPIEKGIIGKAYSIKAPRVENFASDEQYRSRMVTEYNYTIAEVMERTADRRSYICYPVVDENHKVLGLLYFDSDQPNTFTMEQTNPRWQAIRDAGEVIRGNILADS